MSLRQRRFLFWGTIGAVLTVGIVYAFRPQPVLVDVGPADRGELVVTIDEEGMTRVREVFVLSAPVAGYSRRIEVHAGDSVTGGETIVAEIEPIDPSLLDVRSENEAKADANAAEAARSLAEAEFERALAELDFARGEFVRQRGLEKSGVASKRDLDSAERAFKTSRAALATARASVQARSFELDRARARLVSPVAREAGTGDCACISLRAPVSGTVLRVLRESAGVVQAGEPILEIGDPGKLEIIADLLSADAVRVEPDQQVWIEEWGGGHRLHGVVRRIEPYGFTRASALGIEEQRVNVLIDISGSADEWNRLGHGYRVETRIVLWRGEGVLQVPLSALFRHGGDWAVFAFEQGRARIRKVERGRHNGIVAEIRSGLDEGDRVVLYPSERIVEGMLLEARR